MEFHWSPNHRALALAVCSALVAAPAHAGIAELLLKKGVITREEYDQLKQEAAAEVAKPVAASTVVAPAPAAAATSPVPSASAAPSVSFAKGFVVTGIDGSYSAQAGTLMQLDAAGYSNSGTFDNNSGTEMRRGRLYLQGTVSKDWQYRFETEFFGATGTEITDAYVRYNGWTPFGADTKPLAITAGHFKIPFSFEQLMADKDLALMERSLPTGFLKTRAPGVMLSTSGAHWTAAAMGFGEQLYATNTTSNGTSTTTQDEGGGASARVTWAPFTDDGAALHVGFATQYNVPSQPPEGTTPNTDKTLSYSTRPESHQTTHALISTGSLSGDVDDARLYGAEIAATLGPVVLQGEYIRSDVSRDRASDLSFDGWYAQASWALTSEIRAYDADKGIFKGLTPLHPVGAGGSGGWELTARYSEMDLNDDIITGGRERNTTLGLSWYANNFVRISGNWIHVYPIDRKGSAFDDEILDVLQMRMQFAY